MKTLILKEPSGQLMMTPSMQKCYSNQDYKVYRSTFDSHSYVVVRKRDRMCSLCENYINFSMVFDHELQGVI